MRILFLGTGHAWGTPEIGCNCPACRDARRPRSKSRRMRTAIFIEAEGSKILIDCGPDIRSQLLNAKIDHLDALLISHEHADHINGLDDLMAFKRNEKSFKPIQAYATEQTWEVIHKHFGYLLNGVLKEKVIIPGTAFSIGQTQIVPFKTNHGPTAQGSVGFIITAEGKKVVYTSDFYEVLPTPGFSGDDDPRLRNAEFLIIEANWFKEPQKQPLNPHMSFKRALNYIQKWSPKRTLLVHIGHQEVVNGEKVQGLPHREWQRRVRKYWKDVEVAYDGQEIAL